LGNSPLDMQKVFNLIVVQALLSTIAGILISKMSLVGKLGIFFIYKDYGMLKIWWKAALIIFAFQLLFIFLFWLLKQLFGKSATPLLVLLLGIGGLGAYFTYQEFHATSYRLMRSQFHAGGYLVWVGYAISCLFFMFSKSTKKVEPIAITPSTTPTPPPSSMVEHPDQRPLEG
jgi:hypothetical protein